MFVIVDGVDSWTLDVACCFAVGRSVFVVVVSVFIVAVVVFSTFRLVARRVGVGLRWIAGKSCYWKSSGCLRNVVRIGDSCLNDYWSCTLSSAEHCDCWKCWSVGLMCCSWMNGGCDCRCHAVDCFVYFYSSCLHGSVEVTSHTIDCCCKVDVVWASGDTFVQMDVMSKSPVVCTRRCEGCC